MELHRFGKINGGIFWDEILKKLEKVENVILKNYNF